MELFLLHSIIIAGSDIRSFQLHLIQFKRIFTANNCNHFSDTSIQQFRFALTVVDSSANSTELQILQQKQFKLDITKTNFNIERNEIWFYTRSRIVQETVEKFTHIQEQ